MKPPEAIRIFAFVIMTVLFITTTFLLSLAINEYDKLRMEVQEMRRQAVAAGMAEWVMVPGGFKWKEKP